jgi:aminopeptidase N
MGAVHLADYRPAPFLLDRTDLTVRLFHDHAVVETVLAFRPNPAASSAPLVLMGVDLALEELSLDGAPLPASAYAQEADRLVLAAPPQRPFVLASRVQIQPHSNTTLEGLYVSGGFPPHHLPPRPARPAQPL